MSALLILFSAHFEFDSVVYCFPVRFGVYLFIDGNLWIVLWFPSIKHLENYLTLFWIIFGLMLHFYFSLVHRVLGFLCNAFEVPYMLANLFGSILLALTLLTFEIVFTNM